MQSHNKRKRFYYTYSLNSTPLEWVDTFRYLGVRIITKLTWTDHVSEVRMKATHVLNLLCRDVVSRPRPGLTLPLLVPILRYAHQSGHLIRKVPRMIWRRCRSVQPGGYVQSGTKQIVAGPKLMRNAVLF